MDFPEFLRANGIADDPERRAEVEAMVPVERLTPPPPTRPVAAADQEAWERTNTGRSAVERPGSKR